MRVAWRLLGVLLLCLLFGSGYALAARTSVSLTSTGPQPPTVTVDWGDTVAFSNADTVERSVTSQRAEMQSGAIPPGGTYEYRYLGRAGRYSFIQAGTRPTTSGVVVLTASGRVTLRVSRRVVPYGARVALTGQSSYPDTPVVVQFRRSGASGDWAEVLNRNASASGAYAGQLRVTVGGRLRSVVAAGQVSSDIQDVAVIPRLQVGVRPTRVPAGSRVLISGRVVPAGAATNIDLEEFDPERKSWSRSSSRRVARTGAFGFSFRATKGPTRLRIALKSSGLEPGFVPTVSRSLRVIGT
jgi:hypothetical protein